MAFSLARATVTAAVVTVLCFVVASAVGQDQDGWAGDALPQWLGNITWFGFLLGLLATLVLGVALLAKRLTHRSPA